MNLADVASGQDLGISAGDWNAHNAVARWFQRTPMGQKPEITDNNPSVLVHYSATDATAGHKYGSVVVLDAPASLGMDSQNRLHDIWESCLDCRVCAKTDGFDRIGVVYESASGTGADKTLGRVAISGVAVLRCSPTGWNANHTHVRCGDSGVMISGRFGRHRVIKWLSDVSGDTDKWALCSINGDLHDKAPIKIGTPTVIIANRKWVYAFVEQSRLSTGWSDATNGATDATTSKARNMAEANNTAGATVQGNGADFGSEPLTTQTSMVMQPIRGNRVVMGYFSTDESGDIAVSFEASNAVQGPCT